MSKFLVTGGAGFIGSHIVEALVRRKAYVRVLDNFSSGREKNLEDVLGNIELLRGDVLQRDTCFKASEGIDFILHQAALRSVPKSLNNPKDYNEVNIQGTLNMLEAAREHKVKGFIFASSSSVYGEALTFPQKETDLPRLISPYALTKLAGEYYCRIFAKIYGLNTVSLRYFNVFGPRQALDDEYAVVIPKFITCLLKGESPPIYGTGRQSRDFTYVDNVVDANLCALNKPKMKGEVFNVALGQNHTLLELLRILNKILRKEIKPTFEPHRPGDVPKTHADLSKMLFLGFRPKVAFEQGLERTVGYFKAQSLV